MKDGSKIQLAIVPAEDSVESGKAPGPIEIDDIESRFSGDEQALNMPLKFNIDLIHEGTLVSIFKIELPFDSTIGDLS